MSNSGYLGATSLQHKLSIFDLVKILPFILAVFIFYLGIAPCTDALTCSASPDETHHSHEHDEEDTCSPFCSCHCCGIAIDVLILQPLIIGYKKHKHTYKFNYTFNYAYDHIWSTWHPPAVKFS